MAFEMVTVAGLGTMRADLPEILDHKMADLDRSHVPEAVLAIGAFSLPPAPLPDRPVTAGVHTSPRT